MAQATSIRQQFHNTSISIDTIYSTKETINYEDDLEDEEYIYQESSSIYNICPSLSFLNYQPLLSIQAVLLDYKQFKAARIIQRAFRSWSEYRRLKLLEKATNITQRRWRNFYRTNNLFFSTENAIQEELNDYYNKCATKIQALYRGWWSRKYYTDFYNLKKIQIGHLADMLCDLAKNMKVMKYNGLLPGIYSMRNSSCRIKCEDYLSTRGFRYHNQNVQAEWHSTRARLAEHRRSFKQCIRYTPVPYYGHMFNQCEKTYDYSGVRPPRKIDHIILKAITKFTEAKTELARGTHKQRRQKKYTRAWGVHKVRFQEHIMQRKKFCNQLINSMKRWRNPDGTLVFNKHILEDSNCLKLLWKKYEGEGDQMSHIQIPECKPMIAN